MSLDVKQCLTKYFIIILYDFLKAGFTELALAVFGLSGFYY